MPSKIIQSVPVCIAASVALSVDPLWPLRRFFDIGLTLVYAHVPPTNVSDSFASCIERSSKSADP